MGKILVKISAGWLFVSAIIALYLGQYVYATILCGFALWALGSALKPEVVTTIDPEKAMPDPQEIKNYRRNHPGTSIPQAIEALQKDN